MKWPGMSCAVVAAAAAIALVAWRGHATEVRAVGPALAPMLADLRVSVVTPRAGERTEVRAVMARGRVEASGGPAATARVELGLLSGGAPVVSKTVTVRVGEEFSETLAMPGDGPYTFYAGVVRLVNVVRAEDVALRPMAGRDLASGSRDSMLIRLSDDRGRIVDGRVTVYQRGTLIGERWTVAGRAQLCDLAPGEYLANVTSLSGRTESRTVRVSSEGNSVFNLSFPPSE